MLIEFKTLANNWVQRRRLEKTEKKKSRHFADLTVCSECNTFYYNNSWHFEKPENLGFRNGSEVPVHFTQCSACLQQEIALYDMESELVWRKV